MITPKIISAYVKELGLVMEQLEMHKLTCTDLDYDMFYNQKAAVYREMRVISSYCMRNYIGTGNILYLGSEPISITSHFINDDTLMCMYLNLKFPSSIITTELHRVRTKDEYERENRKSDKAL